MMNEEHVEQTRTAVSADETDEMLKSCPHCGRRLNMTIVEHTPDALEHNKFVQFLVRLFSPGGADISQRYRCPRCAHEFSDMGLGEAIVAPALMVAFLVVSLLAFLWFVLYVASTG
jgi:DNA-directed RNA polymerase subunit RPC12/RpoP